MEQQIWNVATNIRENTSFLSTLSRDEMRARIYSMLVGTAASLKHFVFKEEKEWRIIYLPFTNPSKLIRSSVEVVAGIPQIVHKIPMIEDPDNDVVGAGISALIERVIIGPTMYALPMYHAFVRVLEEAGVTNAQERVVVSEIPIRS